MHCDAPTYFLPCHQRFSYAVGHLLNDLCASIWFSYLLVYLHSVLAFNNVMAGYLMLLGQIADGISTPFVGIEATRGCGKYGKRKSWHLLGTLCVAASFPFIFMPVLGVEKADDWAQFIYYAPLIVIFQFGWASTQISHLALINDLTPHENERVELNAMRYAFTVVANVLVYGLAWLLLTMDESGVSDITPADYPHFRTLVLVVVGIGAVFSFIFHLGTQERTEPCSRKNSTNSSLSREHSRQLSTLDWFKEPQFYQIAVLYMFTRLMVNLSQSYMAIYLIDSLKLSKVYIAVIPLAMYAVGFLTSTIMRPVNVILGRKPTYLFGLICVLGASAWLWFIRKENAIQVFGPALLIGIGDATVLVTSLSMTSDLIGNHNESGAFVYGAMSFVDKISSGIAITLIQNVHPCVTEACCAACVWFYRAVMTFVPGGSAILALVVWFTLLPVKIGRLRMDQSIGDEFFGNVNEHNERTPVLPAIGKDDCCNYNICMGSSSDPQARSVLQESMVPPPEPDTISTGGGGSVEHSGVFRPTASYGSTSQTAAPLA